MSRKLFVFDIDGTLLTSENKILESTVIVLEYLKKKQHLIMLATGRSKFLIENLLKQLSIDDYIICNGSAIFLEGKQINKIILNPNEMKGLLEYYHSLEIDVALTGLNNFCRISNFDIQKMTNAMETIGGSTPEFIPNFAEENDIYQGLGFYTEEFDSIFEKKFQEFRFVRWHENFVDIIPKYGSKAIAIELVSQKLGIAKKDIIAFGDSNNDIEMLEMSGIGVAMGNANNSVKEVADFITKSNDDDGIVYALEKLNLL